MADDMTAHMQRLLRYASYAKIGRALGLQRAAVQKWSKGINVGPRQVEQVERLLRESLGIEKEPPPFDWERLMERVEAIAAAVKVKEPVREEAERAARAARAETRRAPVHGGRSDGPTHEDGAQSEHVAPRGR